MFVFDPVRSWTKSERDAIDAWNVFILAGMIKSMELETIRITANYSEIVEYFG